MERYKQHRTASISRIILIYDRGWQVQAGEENGAAEIDLPFLQHQAPPLVGFFVCGMLCRCNKAPAHFNAIITDLKESQNHTEKNESFMDFRIRSLYKIISS